MNLAPAFSQAPSQAQRDAIKSQCRSDYMAHCSSVPPGGEASLQCLQKNMSSLSSGCQGAVRAVEAPAAAAPKAESAPAARQTQSRTGCSVRETRNRGAQGRRRNHGETAEQRAGFRDPQRMPLRLSKGLRRRADRRRPGAAMSGKEQVESLASLRAGGQCRQRRRRSACGGRRSRRRSRLQRPRRPGCPTVIVLRPMRPREELFVLRSACGADVRALCGGVAPGGGRIVQCLATQAASLSPACKDVLGQFAAQ